MKTAENLALLLDSIKREVFGSVRFRITAKTLKHFSSDSIAPKRFRTFHIHKKSGGVRQIKAPCRPLDIILSSVNVLLKAVYEPSDAAMGFVCGRSVLSNAQIHVGQNYVFCIDLKDFFSFDTTGQSMETVAVASVQFYRRCGECTCGSLLQP